MYYKFRNILGMLVVLSSLVLAGCPGESSDSSSNGGCPGSIISNCATDKCPENCAAQGKTEVCVGAGYEPNRCCYCE